MWDRAWLATGRDVERTMQAVVQAAAQDPAAQGDVQNIKRAVGVLAYMQSIEGFLFKPFSAEDVVNPQGEFQRGLAGFAVKAKEILGMDGSRLFAPPHDLALAGRGLLRTTWGRMEIAAAGFHEDLLAKRGEKLVGLLPWVMRERDLAFAIIEAHLAVKEFTWDRTVASAYNKLAGATALSPASLKAFREAVDDVIRAAAPVEPKLRAEIAGLRRGFDRETAAN